MSLFFHLCVLLHDIFARGQKEIGQIGSYIVVWLAEGGLTFHIWT